MNAATESRTASAPAVRHWVVLEIARCTRSGLSVKGHNLFTGEGFTWSKPARELATDIARDGSEYNMDYAVITDERIVRTCQFHGIVLPVAA